MQPSSAVCSKAANCDSRRSDGVNSARLFTGGKMKKTRILGYGIGSLGKDLVNIIISSYLLIFYTNILGISPIAAGIIMMLTKIWDAANDPLMGIIADKTRSRWGKFRPYLLFVPIPLAVGGILTFMPVSFSMAGKIVWAAVTYTFTNTLFTCYDVPFLGMIPSLSKDPNERNSLVTAGRFFTTLAIMIGSIFAYPLIELFGGGSENKNLAKGYPVVLSLFGVVSIICAWIAFFNTKETEHQTSDVISAKKLLICAFSKNRPLYMLEGATLFFSMGMMVATTIGAYYISYVIGTPALIAVYMFALTLAMAVGTLFVPVLLKYLSQKRFILYSYMIIAMSNILMFFIFPKSKNIPLLLILSFISNGAAFAPAIVMTTMVADVADYTANKKGYRADGLIFSVNSFIIKLATAINSGIIGIMLSVCHYDSALKVQPRETVLGINCIRYIYPIAALVISFIFIILYPLNTTALNKKGDTNETF